MSSKNFISNNLFDNDYRNLVLREVYKIFLEKEIKYVCLGNPYYPNLKSGDIDLLILEKDTENTYTCIRNILNKLNFPFLEKKEISINKFENIKFIVDFNLLENVPCLQIDINNSISNKGLVFFDYAQVSNYISEASGVKILDSKMICYLGLLKDLVYCQKIKENRINSNFDKEDFISFLQNLGYSRSILRIYFHNYRFIYLRYFFIVLLFFNNISFKKVTHLIYFYQNLLISIFNGYYKKNLIVFYGPDGAGKSSLIKAIIEKEIFKIYFDNKIKLKHTKPGIIPALSKYKSIFIKQKSNLKMRSTVPLKLQTTLIHFFYYVIDYFLEKLYLSISCIFPKRKIIIYDRHIYEMAYQQTYSKLSDFFINLLKIVSYKPTIIFFIYANSKVIFNRKDELSIKEIEYQINRFNKIDYKFNLKSQKIDNSENLEKSLLKIYKYLINIL